MVHWLKDTPKVVYVENDDDKRIRVVISHDKPYRLLASIDVQGSSAGGGLGYGVTVYSVNSKQLNNMTDGSRGQWKRSRRPNDWIQEIRPYSHCGHTVIHTGSSQFSLMDKLILSCRMIDLRLERLRIMKMRT